MAKTDLHEQILNPDIKTKNRLMHVFYLTFGFWICFEVGILDFGFRLGGLQRRRVLLIIIGITQSPQTLGLKLTLSDDYIEKTEIDY